MTVNKQGNNNDVVGGDTLSGESAQVTVSVIMITYNQENTIDEAIRGVLSQSTDFNFELIIANDASSDSTADHINKWSDRYPERIVKLHREKNLGLQRNFMDAFSKANGRYIAICEGDDWWCSKHKLQRQVDYMESHPDCNVCFHRVVNYYEDEGVMSLSNGGTPSELSISDLATGNVISNLSVMYRRNNEFRVLPEWIADIRLFDYALHMLHAGDGKIHYMSNPMAVYRQRRQGIWSGGNKATQLRMAMATRIRLIEYFRSLMGNNHLPHYEMAVSNLIKGMTEIGLSLLLFYDGIGENSENNEYREAVGLIFKYNPGWNYKRLTDAKMERHQKEIKMGSSPHLLSRVRAAISRFIPLPRIIDGVEVP